MLLFDWFGLLWLVAFVVGCLDLCFPGLASFNACVFHFKVGGLSLLGCCLFGCSRSVCDALCLLLVGCAGVVTLWICVWVILLNGLVYWFV